MPSRALLYRARRIWPCAHPGSPDAAAASDRGGRMSADGHLEALRESALHYARQGWPVLPLHSIRAGRCSCGRDCGRAAGKHPRTQHGSNDASVDEAVIRAWWARWPDANIGVATGSTSGLLVLDVDPAHGGDESFEALVARHGSLSPTPTSLTGGRGRHLLFAHPEFSVPSRCGALGPGA